MKYVIDIEPFEENLFKATAFRTLFFDGYGISRLTPYKEMKDFPVHKVIDRAYEEGKDTAEKMYDKQVDALMDENVALHEQINALESQLAKVQENYERAYEENMEIKSKVRKWVAEMKGRMNG